MSPEDAARLAIEEYWAGTGDEMIFECLEFIHPALTEQDGTTGARRLVNHQLEPLTVTLETGAEATFYPGAFDFQSPERTTQGRRDISLTVAAINLELREQLHAVRLYQPPTQLKAILRKYTENDLNYPGAIEKGLTVVSPKITDTEASASLVYTDTINRRFPRRDYTVETHPGLIDT
jgi:hypothetical protein